MKKLSVLKACIAAVIVCINLSLISCKDDDGPEIIPVKLEDVNGAYKGKLITTQGTIKSEKVVDFKVKKDTMTFVEFPINEIVKSVIKDPVKAEAAITAIGKVKYNLSYTSKVNTAKNIVELSFVPKALEIQIPVDGVAKKTVVTLAAKQKGFYVGQDRSLRFGLVAEKITVEGTPLTAYAIINYDFPYCIKN